MTPLDAPARDTAAPEARPVPLDGALGAAVAAVGGERREGQARMAHAVAAALADDEHLLVQAGTGTGKSLAYLVPAILRTVAEDATVVVATATIALQQQVVARDLPTVVDALAPLLPRRPTYAILKGRRNYLCVNRLEGGMPAEDDDDLLFAPAPTTALGRDVVRLREWAETTTSGDRDELVPGVSERAWSQVSVSSRECLGAQRCPVADRCFAELAREEARTADVVVTNHALLAIHAIEGVPVLPEHDAVVVDEAHELVDRVTGIATDELSAGMVARAGRRATKVLGPDGAEAVATMTGAGGTLVAVLEPLPDGRLDRLPDQVAVAVATLRDAARAVQSRLSAERAADDGAKALARAAVDSLHDVAERLAAHSEHDVVWLAHDDRRGPVLHVAPLAVNGLLRVSLFERSPVVLTSATLTVGGSFDVVARSVGLPPAGEAGDPAPRGGSPRRGAEPEDGAGRRGEGAGRRVEAGEGAGRRVEAGEGAGRRVEAGDGSGARTSYDDSGPAGRAGADADGARADDGRRAIDNGEDADAGEAPRVWRGLDVGSPFDYRRQGILYVARHLPPPGRDGISAAALDELAELAQAAGGRTLGLFSSMRGARAAADAMRARLPYSVLCQGDDRTSTLVRAFAADTRSCLFGTLSLWQGVDVPGASCQLVVIDRIPFPRPDDPLMSARAEAVDRAGGNGFMSVSASYAALRLAQGAGRLIRSATDRGVVAVLDPRLVTARYGTFLRASLPGFWETSDREQVRRSLAAIDAAAG